MTETATIDTLALVTDQSRVLKLQGKQNVWGRAFHMRNGLFDSIGYVLEVGDVIIGPSGTTMAIVTYVDETWRDPPDLTLGRYADPYGVEGANDVFRKALAMKNVPIYGILSTYR